MTTKNANREIEARGQTVDAAIQAGLQQLGLAREKVTIQVLDEGSRGLLGLGSRDAVVRIAPVPAPEPPAAPPPAAAPEPPKTPVPPAPKAEKPPADERKPKAADATPHQIAAMSADADGDGDGESLSDEALEAEKDAAVEVMTRLLELMRVRATVSAQTSEPDDLTGQRVNVIDITGNDLSVLIGPRGEAIDALQFLGRLMVSHQLRRRSNFIVDVEGYRQRRLQALTRLAERMGDKVRQRQEPISLEPMPAFERRVIHMTLRDWPDVYTESAGEGKQRKVRIYPKK